MVIQSRYSEQEHDRTQESSNVDDRTEHEIYAAPFLRRVMASVAAIMYSYDLVNGTYACENNGTLNGILKSEFGFQGFVMSDWGAMHSTISAIAGDILLRREPQHICAKWHHPRGACG